MIFFYPIAVRIIFLGIKFGSLFIPKAKLWVNGRKNWRAKFSAIPFQENKWVWFHCCSFGEFQDGRSVIEKFREKYPDYKILLTFSSPTGYELLKNYKIADHVSYLPLDTKSNAAFFINCVNPAFAFFIRNDIWPNYIHALHKRKIPFFLVSFTLTRKSKFFKFPQKSFYRTSFKLFSAIFVQDKISKDALEENDFNANVIVTGNSRIDRILKIRDEGFDIPEIQKFLAVNTQELTIIAGSTLEKDRQLFLETYLSLKNEKLNWIIVPHEIHKKEIAEAQKLLGDEMILFSEINRLTATHKILWVDHVGLLAKMYRYADIAFIGGGFNSIGIHNILEPAACCCAICFGPNHRNLPEAIDLMKEGARVVNTTEELREFILHYKQYQGELSLVKIVNGKYAEANAGATEKIFEQLENIIPLR